MEKKQVDDFLCLLPKLNIEQINLIHDKFSKIEEINSKSINNILNDNLFSEKDIKDYKNLYEKIESENEKIYSFCLNIFDENYPKKLLNIKPIPKVLYLKGNIDLLNEKLSLGVVGSRKPSPYGTWATKSIVKDLSSYGICIISGMADGIDSISHEAAIKENAHTIAVFGTPVNKIYPTKNRKLVDKVLAKDGLIVSEHHPFEETLPYFFALRNRIISGLSDGILITEAGAKSGTLITANYAIEQGKTVFALPGNVDSLNSQGTNKLIKDGACMVTCVADILYEYNIDEKNIKKLRDIDDLSEIENKILNFVKTQGSCHSEYLAMKNNMRIDEVVAILNILSIKGYLEYDGFMANAKLI